MASASFTAVLATAAYTLLLDQSAPDQSVVLGDFVFRDWEIPEKISWGGAQKVNVHKLVGGDRVIDSMGPDHADLTWSAAFLSDDATERAYTIDKMRKDGQVRPFTFGGRFYNVVVSNFSAEQRMLSWIPYTITLTVQRDDSIGGIFYFPDPLAQVMEDAIAVNSLLGAPPTDLLAAAAVMAGVPVELQALPALVIGTAATEAAIGGMTAGSFFLGNVQADSATRMDALNAQAAQSNDPATGSTVTDAKAAMQQAQDAAQLQAISTSAAGYTNRAINTAKAA